MAQFNRHYRSPALRWAIGASYFVVLMAAVLGLAERASAVFLAIIAVGGVGSLWAGVMAWTRGGLLETPEGIGNRRFLSTRHWSWSEIDEVRSVGSRVFLVLRSGDAIPLIGVAQGYRVTWSDGETRDVVSVLNERLAAWRAEREKRSESTLRPLSR